eukprot:14925197-Alexandrium_andersonii.AAC.1
MSALRNLFCLMICRWVSFCLAAMSEARGTGEVAGLRLPPLMKEPMEGASDFMRITCSRTTSMSWS